MKQDQDDIRPDLVPGNSADGSAASPPISRRALLRGASAAVPTILTLQSGAAMAASSNFLGTVKTADGAIGEGGNVQCIDMASADWDTSTPARLDLGPSPDLHVQYLPKQTYYRTKTGASGSKTDDIVSMEEMCANGGTYWYKPSSGGATETLSVTPSGNPIQRGFLVSSTALASFSSAINYKTYF